MVWAASACQLGFAVDPDAIFDVQVKRIHEYKRQILNILPAAALYHALRADPGGNHVPRVEIVGGKAARLKLVFMINYKVSLAEKIMPAADLSA